LSSDEFGQQSAIVNHRWFEMLLSHQSAFTDPNEKRKTHPGGLVRDQHDRLSLSALGMVTSLD
jgi:hypothetical protein